MNPNPLILDGSGRPPLGTDVWLGANAYRIRVNAAGGVNCATGVQIYQEDGITSSSASILASNNVFTGTNAFTAQTTFAGPTLFQVGFTSNGPSLMTAGGSLIGTFSGSPIFSGTPNFTGGLMATTGTFSGQITSTVLTGTPALVIASTTVIPNLDASFLEGFTWEQPGPIGATTPNSGVFTTLQANTSFKLNGSSALTSVQGTDVKILSADTVAAGAGHSLCTDVNGGATTIGCVSGFTQIQTARIASPCTPPSSSTYDACNSTITWPTAFADSLYNMTCTAFEPGANSGAPGSNLSNQLYIFSQATTSAVVVVQNLRSTADTPSAIECVGIHP